MFSNISILIMSKTVKVVILVSTFLLSACGSVSLIPAASDSAPGKKVNVFKIPNAVPKREPRSRSGNPKSYAVFGKRYYVLEDSKGFVEKGIASWYGTKFHGRRTSSGETYDMYAMTAAHKNLPLPTYVKVTNLDNGKHIVVKVNDRGPFHANRIIDLSYVAAIKLDIIKKGTGLVEVRALEAGQPMPVNMAKGAPVESITKANRDKGFYIQVGSFINLDNAKKLRQKLRLLGKHLVNISQTNIFGTTLHRVRIGPLTDIDQADSIVTDLVNYGVYEHRIVIN